MDALVSCPGCGAPAEVTDVFTLRGVDEHGHWADFLHRRTSCASGHHFTTLLTSICNPDEED